MRRTPILNYASPLEKIAGTADEGWGVTITVFVISTGLVIWGWMDSTVLLLFGAVAAGGIGFVTLERLADYRVFLVDRHRRKFVVQTRSFGRVETNQEYDFDLLVGFEEERNPEDCDDTRILARLATGESIYLHERLKGSSGIMTLARMTARLQQLRTEMESR